MAAGIGGQGAADLRIAIGAALPNMGDGGLDVCIGRVAAQQAAQVVALFGEQAQVELAFGRQPRAVAITAERMGDAADHADFALRRVVLAVGVGIAPALGGFAERRGFEGHQRELAVQERDHIVRRQNLVHAPAVGRAHVHVFDEAQRDAGAPKMARHRQNFVVIGAALDDHVHLDVLETGSARRLDSVQHLGDREVHVVHATEDFVVQAVQAHRHARQTGIAQRARLAGQQRTVGGEREVGHLAIQRAQRGELGDQLFDVLAQQRLATGQANLAHAELQKRARQARDFLEAEQGAVRQIRIVLVEDILGHAVGAAEIAAIGDADAQVSERSLVRVYQAAALSVHHALRHDGRQGAAALVDKWNDAFSHSGDFVLAPKNGLAVLSVVWESWALARAA